MTLFDDTFCSWHCEKCWMTISNFHSILSAELNWFELNCKIQFKLVLQFFFLFCLSSNSHWIEMNYQLNSDWCTTLLHTVSQWWIYEECAAVFALITNSSCWKWISLYSSIRHNWSYSQSVTDGFDYLMV